MKILICSDGTSAAESAIRLGQSLAAPLHADVTLLGIAETADDEEPLGQTLRKEAEALREREIAVEQVVQSGEPVRQIADQTLKMNFDLVIIGARWTGEGGQYWRSARTYDVIKAIAPPVLVAIGDKIRLSRFLVCTGGKVFIEQAVQVAGKLAGAVGATVTLLHVMAEPPAIYADLVNMEEDVDQLLASKSELAINLHQQKKELERIGVASQVRVRHGIVIDQIFEEARQGNYDLIVTGTSQEGGLVRHYIMGDLTRSILNRADCPVLVARAGKGKSSRTFGAVLKRLFAPRFNK